MPFSFHVTLPEDSKAGQNSPARIVVAKSIEADVLNHPSGYFTPEDIIVIHCSPQSVFRVRPATRCSSTLSGIFASCPSTSLSLKRASGIMQDIHPRFSALRSHQPVNSLPLVREIPMYDCGTSILKLLHTHCLVTKAGFSASSGNPLRGS